MNDRTLVLSLFPGIGLLDAAFEGEGFCVVHGPDVIWGGDVRDFHAPADTFAGVIGGPPCQSHGLMAKINEARGYGPRFGNLVPEFERVVSEASPAWFVMENVTGAPEPVVPGYTVTSTILNARWLGDAQNRVRRISFGSKTGARLAVEMVALEAAEREHAVTAGRGLSNARNAVDTRRRTWQEAARVQGMDDARIETLEQFGALKATSLLQAMANAVPLSMGRAVARAVKAATA